MLFNQKYIMEIISNVWNSNSEKSWTLIYFQSLSEEVKKHENAIKDLKQLTTDICIQVGDNKVIKMTINYKNFLYSSYECI